MDEEIDKFFMSLPQDSESHTVESSLRQDLDVVRGRLSEERKSHRTSLFVVLLCVSPFVVGQFLHPSGSWFWVVSWAVVVAGYLGIKQQLPDL